VLPWRNVVGMGPAILVTLLYSWCSEYKIVWFEVIFCHVNYNRTAQIIGF